MKSQTTRIRWGLFALWLSACGRDEITFGAPRAQRDAGEDGASGVHDGGTGGAVDSGSDGAGGETGFQCDADEMCAPRVCDEATRTCVECTDDLHCGRTLFGPARCDPVSRRCVQCIPSSPEPQCGPGFACDPLLSICWLGCESNLDCETELFGAFPFCDTNRGVCVRCLEDADCQTLTGRQPLCLIGACVE